ncbi:ArsR/SmtB family transcription factor [Streptomyces sp. QL37]|uniref:ArsR/SmtB family transcription factor n=1 Tax=Streptomyces sp. QL37 TaxID=2093747 RepID=UPI000CF2C34C|nr:helix-turn-helix domain-containing protein [Streptomyces sp. QL37]PPQ58029.1 ArsR family transcriptional regulator [Streptomyces sp. QL37]
MLRIHFTAEDLEYVRIARGPDPLWEIVCSLCRLQNKEGLVAFGPWRRSVADRLKAEGPGRRAARFLCGLVPYGPYFPDFLTPAVDGGVADLRNGIERVLTTPRTRLRTELELLARASGRPPAGAELARGDTTALRVLGGALSTYDRLFVAPFRERIDAAVASDLAWRSRELSAGGTRALLETFRPMVRWSPPVLEMAYPVERDLYLDGRGLLLVPSYFCWRMPVTLVDDALLPMLVYPVDKPVVPGGPSARSSLARLLGPTRAALLYEIAVQGCASTSELAAAVGSSLPNTSQQLAILREAGLASCRREGRRVLHVPSPLGRQLLDSAGV